MIKKLKYIFVGALWLAIAGAFVSCNEEKAEVDEWSATYVYLVRQSLGGSGASYSLRHTPSGIAGSVNIPIKVRLSKPCATNVEVLIKGEMQETPLQATAVAVIPAGAMEATGSILFDDWKFAVETKAEKSYKGEVTIIGVKPSKGDLRLSQKVNKESVAVLKSLCSNLFAGYKPSGTRIEDRSKWVVSTAIAEGEAATWTPTDKLTDGNKNSYEEKRTYMAVQIDFGSVLPLTGLETMSSYGAGDSHSSCSVQVSADGTTWTDLLEGKRATIKQAATQYISFGDIQKVRYVRWLMWGRYCLSSEIKAYVQSAS